MFRCDGCGGNTGPRIKQVRLVVEARKLAPIGWETVREGKFCPDCAPEARKTAEAVIAAVTVDRTA